MNIDSISRSRTRSPQAFRIHSVATDRDASRRDSSTLAGDASQADVSRWGDRLLGDAAAELRGPLAKVSASIREVASGHLGEVNAAQRESLAAAWLACRRVEEMVEGLRRLNHHRTDRLENRREWFDLSKVRGDIQRAVMGWAPRQAASLVWHGLDRGDYRVFGDQALACRLLIGLFLAAFRESAGGAILVRCVPGADSGAVRLSVSVEGGCVLRGFLEADRGPGRSDVHRHGSMASGTPVIRSSAMADFSVWRHLAAALWTELEVRQRASGGWEIGFELPAGGPPSVAAQWARWRVSRSANSSTQTAIDEGVQVQPAFRDAADAVAAELKRPIGAGPFRSDGAAVLTVSAGAAVSVEAADEFDRRLVDDLGIYDVAYRISPRRWVMVWDLRCDQARTRIETLAASRLRCGSPIRLHWSAITTLPLHACQTGTVLADRLTRELLSSAEPSALVGQPDGGLDDEWMRPSSVPGDRLVAEMRSLATRVRKQNAELERQASDLRKIR
jgi:hypothetical protein